MMTKRWGKLRIVNPVSLMPWVVTIGLLCIDKTERLVFMGELVVIVKIKRKVSVLIDKFVPLQKLSQNYIL